MWTWRRRRTPASKQKGCSRPLPTSAPPTPRP
nr:MAG TPA: hypothetical protein [Caudoviricetes sp.]